MYVVHFNFILSTNIFLLFSAYHKFRIPDISIEIDFRQYRHKNDEKRTHRRMNVAKANEGCRSCSGLFAPLFSGGADGESTEVEALFRR